MATTAQTIKPVTVAGVLSLKHVLGVVWRIEIRPGIAMALIVPMGKS